MTNLLRHSWMAQVQEITTTDDDGSDPGMLYRMGEALLNTTVSVLMEHGLAVPGRRFVYPGTIPADCELLAVLFTGWTSDAYSPPIGMVSCADYLWVAGFSVVIVRCTPALPTQKGKPPTAEMMSRAAMIASRDAEALTDVVAAVGEHGGGVSVVTGPPSGGMQTVELDIQLPYGGSTIPGR